MNELKLITEVSTFVTGLGIFLVIFLIAVKKYLNQKNEIEDGKRPK